MVKPSDTSSPLNSLGLQYQVGGIAMHVNEIVKKAAKRLYFLVHLKTAKFPNSDLLMFYCACIRSVLTYAIPQYFIKLCPCISSTK